MTKNEFLRSCRAMVDYYDQTISYHEKSKDEFEKFDPELARLRRVTAAAHKNMVEYVRGRLGKEEEQ